MDFFFLNAKLRLLGLHVNISHMTYDSIYYHMTFRSWPTVQRYSRISGGLLPR